MPSSPRSDTPAAPAESTPATAPVAAAAATSLAKRRREAWVQAEALNVAPALVGEPLAPASRRALAMLIDLAVVSLIANHVHALVLMGALVAGAAWLWAERRARRPSRAAMVLATLLVATGLVASVGDRSRLTTTDEPDADSVSDVAEKIAEAATALAALQGASAPAAGASAAAGAGSAAAGAASAAMIAPASGAGADPSAAAVDAASRAGSSAAAVTAAPAASSASAAQALAQALTRLEALEAHQAKAAQTDLDRLRRRLTRWLDEVGPGYGWSLLYWSLLPMLWSGQTLGKRLCGLRVVELTGRPMTAWLGLKRYGGYAAGLATGGLGLAQVLWDPNRQGLHDKAAHTVVIDLRAPRRPASDPQP